MDSRTAPTAPALASARADVLVVGAGPAGLTLTADLLRRGIDVRLIDAAAAPAETSRATSLTPRTLEVLDDLGVGQDLIDTGIPIRIAEAFQGQDRAFRLAFPETAPTRYPFLLNNSQRQTEELLASRVAELGGRIERERRLIGFRQDRRGVVALVSGTEGLEEIQADYLVGADGGRSTVRSTLGIPFEARAGTLEETIVLADVLIDWDQPADRLLTWFNGDGALLAFPFKEPGRWRITAALSPAEEADGRYTEDSLDDFTALYRRRTGDTTSTLSDMRGFSVYRVNQRVVDTYRRGRALVIGDAAHVHTPAGGLGMNTGIQDAYSLGWRLARAVIADDDAGLADFERERRPVALALLSRTGNLQRLWSIRDPRLQRLRNVALQSVLDLGVARRGFFAGASQLGISYRSRRGIRGGTRLRVGDRMPDGRVAAPGESSGWLYEHLRGTGPVVVAFEGHGGSDPALARRCSQDAVRLVRVTLDGSSEALRDVDGELHDVVGEGRVVVLRPDSHVAAVIRRGGDVGAILDALAAARSPLPVAAATLAG